MKPMKTIEQTYTIKAPIAKVWQALTDTSVIEDWGAGPNVVMDDQVGTQFKLWDGEIYGKNLKVVAPKLLVQEWYSDNFMQPSEATFSLESKGDATVLKLVHKDLADDCLKDIGDGWKDYYLGPLKDFLEG